MPSRTASAFPPASTDLAERLRLIELETTPEQRLRSAVINQLAREQTAGKCAREYREPSPLPLHTLMVVAACDGVTTLPARKGPRRSSTAGTPARYFGATLSCVRGAK